MSSYQQQLNNQLTILSHDFRTPCSVKKRNIGEGRKGLLRFRVCWKVRAWPLMLVTLGVGPLCIINEISYKVAEIRKSIKSNWCKYVSLKRFLVTSVCKPMTRATWVLLFWPTWPASSVCKPTTFVVAEMGLSLVFTSSWQNVIMPFHYISKSECLFATQTYEQWYRRSHY